MVFSEYDVIVVGGGHAGCEAAAAAARMGSRTLLITHSLQLLAQMSCNPSIGGIAKGQIVREIDALGGFTGIVADKSTIQYRMLNKSKGPAMWSPRTQNDRLLFSMEWRRILEKIPNLEFWQDDVVSVTAPNEKVSGVTTAMGLKILAKAVIVTAGTFLNGQVYIGKLRMRGGRIGERSSDSLTSNLSSMGILSDKLKTGTPLRVDGRSLDFSKMLEQPGDEFPETFSFLSDLPVSKQRSCFLAYTNSSVHDILKTGFGDSPLFGGEIEGVGPRYCPSIEDKLIRFSDKDSHQLFVEPDGWQTDEYYINGFSSSLPIEVQFSAIRNVVGFENAKILRPGYAIEYDFFPPEQLSRNLESRVIEGLFFAGQVNGTTGYEEAAGQGLMAGINAHCKINGLSSVILLRSEAYIGVLIDDLINKGVKDPYRMFTSRAEYRLLLRQDNADIRLTPLAEKLGLASEERSKLLKEKMNFLAEGQRLLRSVSVGPGDVNVFLESKNSSLLRQRTKLFSLLQRPEISMADLAILNTSFYASLMSLSEQAKRSIDTLVVDVKYESYLEREWDLAEKMKKMESLIIPSDFDYSVVSSISFEAREKLIKLKPQTIGQAQRISGVSPADISVLLVMLG